MIKINISTVKAVLEDFDIPRSELNAFAKVVRDVIMLELRDNLIKQAKQKLSTSRAEYIAGIRLDSNVLYLEGFLPNAVESGLSPFDQKEGFQKSNKTKRSKKGGWYLTIPFRVGTPNSGGISSSTVMSREIYKAIRAKKAVDTSNLPVNTRQAVTNPKTGKIWEEYENKFSVLSGITQTSHNPITNRSTYGTFRRVSNNSDPNSWIHTGIIAHNLLDEAWRETDVEKIIDEGLELLF